MTLKPRKLDCNLPASLPLIVYSDKEWVADKKELIHVVQELDEDEVVSSSRQEQKAILKVVPEALEVLKSINKPLSIFSICGPFRTGKSYLISQILGSPGTFKVGHKYSACTKGVWMATTVLECDDFAVVFLDTEGMDSPDDSADINKLLIVTTLFSSMLVYNSQTVPDLNDLEDLSCFAQLSSRIAMRDLSEDQYDSICSNFPDFLWLVRDALELPSSDGQQITPKEYLNKYVLVRSGSRKLTDRDEIVSAILRLFPSVQCRTLPRPSADPKIVTNMEEKDDLLEPTFKEELSRFVEHVRSNLRVKRLSNMHCSNGPIWAELLIRHVKSVNGDEELVLGNMYVTAAESALSKLSQRLITNYKKEMEKATRGKFPMEECSEDSIGQCETLLSIHNRITVPDIHRFQKEIDNFLPIASSEEDASVEERKKSLLRLFKEEICLLSKNESEEVRIVGGALHRFVLENHRASRQQCQRQELTVFRDVRVMIREAATKQSKIDISAALKEAEIEYFKLAIGPAKDEVYREVRQKLSEDSQDLIRTIPGKPKDLYSIGEASDKIKLQWTETNQHCDVVDYYQVQKMSGNDNWKTLPDHFPTTTAIVHNLKSSKKYQFQVRGVGKTGIIGNWSDSHSCSTTVGSVSRGVATFGTFLGGMVACPAAGLLAAPILGPISIVGGVIAAPVAAALLAKNVAKQYGPQGELKTPPPTENSEPFSPGDTTDSLSSSNATGSLSASIVADSQPPLAERSPGFQSTPADDESPHTSVTPKVCEEDD